jgi:hypothetical protein
MCVGCELRVIREALPGPYYPIYITIYPYLLVTRTIEDNRKRSISDPVGERFHRWISPLAFVFWAFLAALFVVAIATTYGKTKFIVWPVTGLAYILLLPVIPISAILFVYYTIVLRIMLFLYPESVTAHTESGQEEHKH